jgi:hypothetical protein
MIDGQLFDDDPRQGVIEGRTFRTPTCASPSTRRRLRHPERHSAVSVTAATGQAVFSDFALSTAIWRICAARRCSGTPASAGPRPVAAGRATITGLPAVACRRARRTQQLESPT